MHDHFHVVYEHDGQQCEIEGGFPGHPKGYRDMPYSEKTRWWRDLCIAWGMPDTATIKRLWLSR